MKSGHEWCQTCGRKHAGTFFTCKNCGYTSCVNKDGGRGSKCPSCGKAERD